MKKRCGLVVLIFVRRESNGAAVKVGKVVRKRRQQSMERSMKVHAVGILVVSSQVSDF